MDHMNSVFVPYLDKFFIIYLDGILIYSYDKQEHLEHAREVLDVQRKNKLYAKRSKCTFEVYLTEYLRFILKGYGFERNLHKTSAIEPWAFF